MACRGVSVLHLTVDGDTPSYLRSGADADGDGDVGGAAENQGKKKAMTTRVPALRARKVSWNRPGAASRCTGRTLSSARFFVGGDELNDRVDGAVWPRELRRLSFGKRFDQPLSAVSWPLSSLLELSFAWDFNQPLDGVSLPSSLERLTFGLNFDQPIASVRWPASLRYLCFGKADEGDWIEGDFDQPVVGVTWPPSLRRIIFGSEFNEPIRGGAWPASLRELMFNGAYNTKFGKSLIGVSWPPSLERLSLGWAFNQGLEDMCWRASLKHLTLSRCFNRSVDQCLGQTRRRSSSSGPTSTGSCTTFSGRVR